MHTLKLSIVLMFATNLLLLGMEASNPPERAGAQASGLPATKPSLPEIVMRSEMPEAVPPLQACFTVGPFESGETSDAIAGLLSEHDYASHQRETQAFVDRGYWVYLPPFENERAAREAIEVLYAGGLEDVALIQSGEWSLSVSLGYFIEQSNAVRRREYALKIGFPAEMRVQREDESRYWVDYEITGIGNHAPSALLNDLVPEMLHREISCAGLSHEALPVTTAP